MTDDRETPLTRELTVTRCCSRIEAGASEGATLTGIHLTGADLRGAKLRAAILPWADLIGMRPTRRRPHGGYTRPHQNASRPTCEVRASTRPR